MPVTPSSMMPIIASLLSLLLTLLMPGQQPGERLKPWTPGTLDIHQINTGRGNSAFFIFPDGTTMIVDAGSGGHVHPRGTTQRPDSSRAPGEWIARYILRQLAHDRDPHLDYGYITHFHDDHMGGFGAPVKTSASGAYKLTGMTEVGEHVRINKMIDRGWPDYNFPAPALLANQMVDNYRAFLRWQGDNRKMKVERLAPGRNDQIVLVRERAKYPQFEVRNIAANGEIWTGVATNTRKQFPQSLSGLSAEDQPTENMCSLAIRVSYGKFDYFTGGDMPGVPPVGSPIWHDIETPVAQAVGPVEVSVLNHHGNRDSMNPYFVSALRPQIFVIPVWSSDHPGHDVLARLYSKRLYPDERDIFATNMIEANRIVIGPLLDRLKSSQGHILLRVAPGGDSFQVIILDDEKESDAVKAVFGPYQSR
jgi:beta-lactamase superfamily II metal-dependent hydrolase